MITTKESTPSPFQNFTAHLLAATGMGTLLKKYPLNRFLAHPLTRNSIPIDSPEMITIHRKIIESKKLLRLIYQHWYSEFQKTHTSPRLRALPAIEIGSGASHLEQHIPTVIKTDVVPHPNVQYVARAEALPFPSNALGSIFLTNVLHHIPAPRLFFREAERCLADRGKIVMIEPANSFLTRLLFGNFHETENWDYSADKWETENVTRLSRANMAIPAIIFERDRKIFESEFPHLHIISIRRHTCFAYFLSGGVSVRELVPKSLASLIWKIDCLLCRLFPSWGSQMTIELEKQSPAVDIKLARG